MQDERRVVITGLGVVCALGFDEKTFWSNLLAGRNGIRTVTRFDVSGFRTKVASEIDDEPLAAGLKKWRIRPTDRSVDIGILAASEALASAGLADPKTPPEPQPLATLFGTSAGPAEATFLGTRAYLERGLPSIRPSTVPTVMVNAVAAQISMRFRLQGPNLAVVSACSSSTAAIGQGFRMIRHGYAPGVLAGGTEAIIYPLSFGAWTNLGVMSTQEDPELASRPFDVDRDGLVMGEGAGALVLESLATARARGASIRAEIVGFGESSDAHHLTRPDPDGQARAMSQALDSAGVAPDAIRFINAHGSATPTNDSCEVESIRKVFGPAADRLQLASNKSFFGHTMGAGGVLETAATVLGLENGRVPGNRNLVNPDPKCDIPLVGREAIQLDAPLAMKNSFGFGGHNAVLVLRRWEA